MTPPPGWQDCVKDGAYEILSTLLGGNVEVANAPFVFNHKIKDIGPILVDWFPADHPTRCLAALLENCASYTVAIEASS